MMHSPFCPHSVDFSASVPSALQKCSLIYLNFYKNIPAENNFRSKSVWTFHMCQYTFGNAVNSELSWENETKIVKITHSALYSTLRKSMSNDPPTKTTS